MASASLPRSFLMTKSDESTTQRIKNAIAFFRQFSKKSDSLIYRRAVLRFCDLIELAMTEKDIEKTMF
jgi:hypothetical protein